MRYFIATLVALLVAAPAAAVAGPDALSIAKRALALAKEPPNIEYVSGRVVRKVESPVGFVHRATCPRGMLPVNALPEFATDSVWIRGRSIYAFEQGPPTFGNQPILIAVCIEGRLKR